MSALPKASPESANLAGTGLLDPPPTRPLDYKGFWQNHPEVARYIPHIIEAFITCSKVNTNVNAIDLEVAYAHIFGSAGKPACPRCQGVLNRLKHALESELP